ncbi:MAG: hypothetical protein HC853_04125, partial [Anaerolineae bacterium]|nr:hypothetical protein [Anaerolineae bacterium]
MSGLAKRNTCIRRVLFVCLCEVLTVGLQQPALSLSRSLQYVGAHADAASSAWTSYSQADWLASNSILSVYQDRDGFTWVGTNEGLSVHSPGNQWLTFSTAEGLAGEIVTDITPDPLRLRGRWVASFGGVSLLEDAGDPIERSAYTSVAFTKADGLVEQFASSVAADANGHVWIGTANIDDNGNEFGFGLSMLDTNQTPYTKTDDVWTTYTAGSGQLSSNLIRDIAIDSQGAVWVAT